MRGIVNKAVFSLAFIALMSIMLIQEIPAGIGDYSGSLNYVVDFEPNLKKTFSFFATADSSAITDYEVTVEGPLAQYFTLSDTLLKSIWPRQIRPFTAILQFPAEKPPAGLHEHFLCVGEPAGGGGGGINIRTRACSIIKVRVLYPEKYLKIEYFNIPNADVGDVLEINIGVKSWSEQDINSVKAIIDLFGPSEKGFDKQITTLATEEKPLPSNGDEILSAKLNTRNLESGEYNAIATVYYDSDNVSASTRFKVGILAVKVVNYTKEVVRDKVNKLDIDIESRWNSPIENVYADVIMYGEKNETLTTPTVNLKAWDSATLTAYWDTAGKKAKYYDGRIILHFAGNATEQDIRVKMLINPEEIKKLITYVAITILIVLLIVITVLIFLKKPPSKKIKRGK